MRFRVNYEHIQAKQLSERKLFQTKVFRGYTNFMTNAIFRMQRSFDPEK
jgi:hypothetical protein